MADKKALAKAYDAGQAAQLYGVEDDACPFEEGSEEHAAYMNGKAEKLADKWTLGPGGRRLRKALNN